MDNLLSGVSKATNTFADSKNKNLDYFNAKYSTLKIVKKNVSKTNKD